MAMSRAAATQNRYEDKKATMTEQQTSTITAFDKVINMGEEIKARKPEFDTGKISSAQNWLAQTVGMDDSQKTAFKSDIESQLADYVRSISGTAAAEKERIALMQILPKFSDNDETFSAKLDSFIKRAKQGRAIELENYRRLGKNISKFSVGPAQSSGADPETQAAKEWLEANPNDPDADAVRQKLGL